MKLCLCNSVLSCNDLSVIFLLFLFDLFFLVLFYYDLNENNYSSYKRINE